MTLSRQTKNTLLAGAGVILIPFGFGGDNAIAILVGGCCIALALARR